MASYEQTANKIANAQLVADIGGTHCNFGLVLPPMQGVQWIEKLKIADFPNVVAAVQSYLTTLAKQNDLSYIGISCACFAVATWINGDHIVFTNSSWSFSIKQVEAALGLGDLQVINDFAALALSLPNLTENDLRMVSNHRFDAFKYEGTLAVVGPGTGLGVAGLMRVKIRKVGIRKVERKKPDHRWVALSSEGGHASLSGANALEWEIIQLVRNQYAHVSAERLLSGMGMPLLYQTIAQLNGVEVQDLTSPEIIVCGLDKSDVIADQTLDVFCAMLGGFCGNVVLTLGAASGLFMGGGIIGRLGERFFTSSFVQRFEAKGRYEAFLKSVPIALIMHPYPALNGCVLAIEQA